MATTSSKKSLRFFTVSRRTSAALRQAVSSDDIHAFQKAWLDELARPLKRIRKQLKSVPLLALWSENAVELSGRERELAVSLDDLASGKAEKRNRRKEKRSKAKSPYEDILANWLLEAEGTAGPWEAIAVAEILLREGHCLSAERFTAAFGVLANSALRETETIGGLFENSEVPSGSDDAIRQMIGSGESPWLCSLLLSPLKSGPTLQKKATETLEQILIEATDSDGLVHGSLLKRLLEWLAPLARCTFWSRIFEEAVWSNEASARLTAVVERAFMLVLPAAADPSGGESPELKNPDLAQLLEFLLPLTASSWEGRLQKLLKQSQKPAAREVSRPKKLKTNAVENDSKEKKDGKENGEDAVTAKSVASEKKKLVASWESDTSCVGILRSGLEVDADVATLEWHSSEAQILLAAAGVPILTGHWDWSVRLDDEVVPGPSTWKCSCWFLDPETVFIELEGEDSAPVKRVRQILLAPHDRFAILTDSVTCRDAERKVQLVTSLPLAERSACVPDPITRELSITVGPRTVRTFPVWLADDRIQHTLGSYQEHDGQLELSGIGRGGVTMPLALDWHPKRTEAPADWARLTVTEARKIVSDSEATGHRVRIGVHQVLVYRSLIPPKNSRAVMGLHTWDESVYSRVPSKPGALTALVEVESPE